MKAIYTPDEFAEFICKDPKAAVDWLREVIGEMENAEQQMTAKALLLLVLVAQTVRLLLHHTEDEFEDLMARLARLSIKLDEQVREFLEEWIEA